MIAQDAGYVVLKYGTAAANFAADAKPINANVLRVISVLANHVYVMFPALSVKICNMRDIHAYVII